MLHRERTLVVALGLVVASALSAEAMDLCVVVNPSTTIGKKFKVPLRNQCKPFNGFTSDGLWFVTGTGCTDADGKFFRLQYTANATIGHTMEGAYCGIPLPSLSGGTCVVTGVTGETNSVFSFTDIVDAAPCIINVP